MSEFARKKTELILGQIYLMGQIILVGQIILMRQNCQKMRQFYDKLEQLLFATNLSISVTKMYRSATTFIYMITKKAAKNFLSCHFPPDIAGKIYI